MNLVRDKVFFGFVSILLVAYPAFFLFHTSPQGSPQTYFYIASSYLIFLNIAIASGWFAFGWVGGAVISALSIVIALIISLAGRSHLYYLHIGIFVASTVLSYNYLRGTVRYQTDYFIKKEKLVEERNTLHEKLEKDRRQTESLDLKLRRYESLKTIADELSDIFSLDKVIRFLVDKSYEIVGKSQRSLLYLVDAERQELVLSYSRQPKDFPRIKTKRGDMFDKWVLRQNQPLIVLDAAKDFRFPHEEAASEELNFKSIIAVPISSHNKTIGLLRLDSIDTNIYSPDDLRLLDIIGDLGAISLHNNMLYERMTELAIRDGLTQLFVYRYFMERLEAELARAFERGHSLSVLMIDIDYFKDYNDRYGHIAGDILLKHLAGIFTSMAGKGNIVSRYGGEEFALLAFGEGKDGAVKLAQKIRKVVELEPFYLRRAKTSATVSIGVSTFPDDAKRSTELLAAADRNLYRAKREGRNRVCIS